MSDDEEIFLKGFAVSEGVAIGTPFFLSEDQESLPDFVIAAAEVEEEIDRYRRALYSSREDLKHLQNRLEQEGSLEAIEIIDVQFQMLNDPLITKIEDEIRLKRQNTETIFRSSIIELEKRWVKSKDLYFEKRLSDVKDLSKRILRHLSLKHQISLVDIPHNSIIFAYEISPSDTAEAHSAQVSGIVTKKGGGASHTGLIARSKGIPYVDDIDIEFLKAKSRHCVIVDGLQGLVIVNPQLSTIKKYDSLKKEVQHEFTSALSSLQLKSETEDGRKIQLLANIENVNDISLVDQYGGVGVGLFRSEYLFLHREVFSFSEEEQFYVYSQILKRAEGLPVVIRLFDVGADKVGPPSSSKMATFPAVRISEPNPALGCRAIRLLLRQKEVFRTQVKAILRASIYGDVRILLPLITDTSEVQLAKKYIEEAREELLAQGVSIKESIPLGAMIEVPSAALTVDLIADECDFLSVGTNDLTQYTLAVDRSDPRLREMYQSCHPALLRMLQIIIKEALLKECPLTICGEIASNPLYLELLIGLGVERLSCPPRFIPIIRNMLQKVNYEAAVQVAIKILSLKTAAEVHQMLVQSLEAKREIIHG